MSIDCAKWLSRFLGAGLSAGLAGCIVSPTHDAPIVDRSQVRASEAPAPAKPPPTDKVASSGAREAHDGLYTVQVGDTLYSVALAFGQDYRDIARWNSLADPAQLKVGQSLRVVPADMAAPDGAAPVAEAVPVPASPTDSVQTRPLEPATGAAVPDTAAETHAPPPEKAAVEPEGVWNWPCTGKVLDRFDETRNKGIDIAGSIGDAVLAANDGQVVYSGNGLRGYGNLVIIKHTDDFVSAYAHNNEILVTQGQAVKRGQKIAALGMTEAPDPRLHFEIRRRGKPVDPLMYLPSR